MSKKISSLDKLKELNISPKTTVDTLSDKYIDIIYKLQKEEQVKNKKKVQKSIGRFRLLNE